MYDRPANIADWLVMKTVGETMQGLTWEGLIERMIEESGGVAAGGIEQEEESLDEPQAELIEAWVKDLVLERKRHSAAS